MALNLHSTMALVRNACAVNIQFYMEMSILCMLGVVAAVVHAYSPNSDAFTFVSVVYRASKETATRWF